MNESILDKPQDTLDPSVWNVADGNVTLTEEASAKIQKAIDYVQGKWNFPDLSVFIIGSITSNSYSPDSDIDIDFVSPNYVKKPEAMEVGWKIKSDFIDNYAQDNPDDARIGSHPLEIYFQPNPFQCMMSVGCYDFLAKQWIVGPDLKEKGFDPIATYYSKSMKVVKSIVNDIRNVILEVYEEALVIEKSSSIEFRENEAKKFFASVSKAGKLFKQMKKARTSYQREPQSKEDALKMRQEKKWHVADAAFKFLDKFGYVSILKEYCEIDDEENADLSESTAKVIEAVRTNFSSNTSLNDSEKHYFTEVDSTLNEGPKEAVSAGLLAVLLAVPGILSAKQVQRSIDKNQKYEMIVKDMNNSTRMIGNYTAFQAANIIARTLYAEARNDGKVGMEAVASVIYNRAEGDKTLFTNACLKRLQFSCWNKFTKEEADPKNFKIKIPSSVKGNAKNEKLWKEAMAIAADMLADAFAPTTKANMYYAKSMVKPPSWANTITKKETIGSHYFGYLSKHSRFT